jgi:hypothetical protein
MELDPIITMSTKSTFHQQNLLNTFHAYTLSIPFVAIPAHCIFQYFDVPVSEWIVDAVIFDGIKYFYKNSLQNCFRFLVTKFLQQNEAIYRWRQ